MIRLPQFFSKQGLKESYKLFFFELARYNDFFVRMIPFRPMSADFNITDNCNSRCIACTCWKQKSHNELTTEEVNEILIQLKNIGIRRIGFAGGEPLLRKDLPQLIKNANDLNFDNIHMVTNGLLLTKEKAESLIESGLRTIRISIDGTADVHDYVRGIEGSYEKSIKALKMLTKLRDSKYPNINIGIGTTLMKPTLNEIIKVVEVAKELNVDWGMNLIDTSPYFFKGVDASELLIRNQDELNELIDELHKIKIENPKLIGSSHIALEYARNYFENPKRESIPCYLGFLKIYIGPHGEVYSGCWVLTPLGNLRENTLIKIISSSKYRNRLKNMILKKCPGCSCYYPTNLLYHFPSLYDEIKWHIQKK